MHITKSIVGSVQCDSSKSHLLQPNRTKYLIQNTENIHKPLFYIVNTEAAVSPC